MNKLTSFKTSNETRPVEFVETMNVKDGVVCDVYTFPNDQARDLGIISVAAGCRTPRQRVLQGTKTIEGFMDGAGVLTVACPDNTVKEYTYPSENAPAEVEVAIGEVMQWHADHGGLTFYEICEPPYQPGRYIDLPDLDA